MTDGFFFPFAGRHGPYKPLGGFPQRSALFPWALPTLAFLEQQRYGHFSPLLVVPAFRSPNFLGVAGSCFCAGNPLRVLAIPSSSAERSLPPFSGRFFPTPLLFMCEPFFLFLPDPYVTVDRELPVHPASCISYLSFRLQLFFFPIPSVDLFFYRIADDWAPHIPPRGLPPGSARRILQ